MAYLKNGYKVMYEDGSQIKATKTQPNKDDKAVKYISASGGVSKTGKVINPTGIFKKIYVNGDISATDLKAFKDAWIATLSTDTTTLPELFGETACYVAFYSEDGSIIPVLDYGALDGKPNKIFLVLEFFVIVEQYTMNESIIIEPGVYIPDDGEESGVRKLTGTFEADFEELQGIETIGDYTCGKHNEALTKLISFNEDFVSSGSGGEVNPKEFKTVYEINGKLYGSKTGRCDDLVEFSVYSGNNELLIG